LRRLIISGTALDDLEGLGLISLSGGKEADAIILMPRPFCPAFKIRGRLEKIRHDACSLMMGSGRHFGADRELISRGALSASLIVLNLRLPQRDSNAQVAQSAATALRNWALAGLPPTGWALP
jgi:hypothetical protein